MCMHCLQQSKLQLLEVNEPGRRFKIPLSQEEVTLWSCLTERYMYLQYLQFIIPPYRPAGAVLQKNIMRSDMCSSTLAQKKPSSRAHINNSFLKGVQIRTFTKKFGGRIKYLLTELGQARQENIWLLVKYFPFQCDLRFSVGKLLQ